MTVQENAPSPAVLFVYTQAWLFTSLIRGISCAFLTEPATELQEAPYWTQEVLVRVQYC